MPKTYTFERKVNLKRITGIDMFENTTFRVEGCASKKEAQADIEEWVKEYVEEGKKKILAIKEKKEKEALEAPPFEHKQAEWEKKTGVKTKKTLTV